MKPYRINNILVPVDFSPISMNALRHAEILAKRSGGRIKVLHVVQPYYYTFGDGGMAVAATRLEKRMYSEGVKKLSRTARYSTIRAKVPVETLVLSGDIATMITMTATKIKADLIVMGTHGAKGFVDQLLGSTTYRVAALSAIPVLSVPKQAHGAAYKRIVYPIREESHAAAKFPHALTLAKLWGATIDVLGFLRLGQRQRLNRMRSLCAVIKRDFVRQGVKAKTVFTSKEAFADETLRQASPHSLVVIYGDSDLRLVDLFHRSFTKGILHSSASPVLMVPVHRRKR